LCFVGERAVLVPRHVGLGERCFPWIERDGAWVEDRSVPPFTKSAEKSRDRCVARGVRLGDGSDVLLWNGWCLEPHREGFARTFEHRLDVPWWTTWEPAPVGPDGFFYLDANSRLFEARRGGEPPRAHLPELTM